jgi:hypothetical protein
VGRDAEGAHSYPIQWSERERGFISFKDSGEVLISPRVDRDDLRRLGFQQLAWEQYGFSEAPPVWSTVEAFEANQCRHLDYHRRQVFYAPFA